MLPTLSHLSSLQDIEAYVVIMVYEIEDEDDFHAQLEAAGDKLVWATCAVGAGEILHGSVFRLSLTSMQPGADPASS